MATKSDDDPPAPDVLPSKICGLYDRKIVLQAVPLHGGLCPPGSHLR